MRRLSRPDSPAPIRGGSRDGRPLTGGSFPPPALPSPPARIVSAEPPPPAATAAAALQSSRALVLLSASSQAGATAAVSESAQTAWFARASCGVLADLDADAAPAGAAHALARALAGGFEPASASELELQSGASASSISSGSFEFLPAGGGADGGDGAGRLQQQLQQQLEARIAQAIAAAARMDAGWAPGEAAAGASAEVGGAAALPPTPAPMQALSQFLRRVVASHVEPALRDNAALDVFRDELLAMQQPAAGAGSAQHGAPAGAPLAAPAAPGGASAAIREERQLSDLALSSGRALPALAWQPLSGLQSARGADAAVGVAPLAAIAVAVASRAGSLERQLSANGRPQGGHVLLFSLSEAATARALELPAVATCLSWHPAASSGGGAESGLGGGGAQQLLAVGCANGQVAVFDLAAAEVADTSLEGRRDGCDARDDEGWGGLPSSSAATGLDGSGGSSSSSSSSSSSRSSSGGSSRGGRGTRRLAPHLLSALEASHARAVAAVHWLPAAAHVNARGSVAAAPGGHATQLLSVGTEGGVAVWDIEQAAHEQERVRLLQLSTYSAPALPQLQPQPPPPAPPSFLVSALIPGATAAEVPACALVPPWTPLYRATLRTAGLAAIAVSAVLFPAADREGAGPLLVGTEGGLVAAVDWGLPGEGSSSGAGASALPSAPASAASGGGGGSSGSSSGSSSSSATHAIAGDSSRVLWQAAEDCTRPILALARHPAPALAAADVFLAVSDGGFSVWRRGGEQPLLSLPSAPAAAPLTCGCWSPTRAGLLFVGRADGSIEAWDLLEALDQPALRLPLSSAPVASMAFRPGLGAAAAAAAAASPLLRPPIAQQSQASQPQQLLAVGDDKGTLRILDVPPALCRGAAGEDAAFLALLNGEAARLAAAARRAAELEALLARQEESAPRSARRDEREAHGASTATDFASATAAALEAKAAAAASAAAAAARELAETQFRLMEQALMLELGMSPTPLPATLAAAAAPAAAAATLAAPATQHAAELPRASKPAAASSAQAPPAPRKPAGVASATVGSATTAAAAQRRLSASTTAAAAQRRLSASTTAAAAQRRLSASSSGVAAAAKKPATRTPAR